MPLDGLTLGFAARELDGLLTGGRIDRIVQPERNQLVLFLRAGSRGLRLLLSATPGSGRMHLTQAEYPGPPEAPALCMLMRRHLLGGRVLGIRQLGGDRLLRMDIRAPGEWSGDTEKQLYLEATGKHSNLVLVQDGRVLDAARRITEAVSRVRRVFPGEPYEMPPSQDRLAPGEADGELLYERLAGQTGPLYRAVAEAVRGLSPVSARELVLRLTGDSETVVGFGPDLRRFSAGLAELLSRLPGMAAPVLLLGGDGLPADVFPFPFLSYPRERQQPCSSLSEALDTLWAERDQRNRLAQGSVALRRHLKSASERCGRKLALQEEEIAQASRREEYLAAGEALLAFAGRVPRGAREAVLPDYRSGGEIRVQLDPALSPQANSQVYFKKYRKAEAAGRLAREQKEKTLRELARIEEAAFSLELAERPEDIGDIRRSLAEDGLLRRPPPRNAGKREKESEPLRFVSSGGLRITVGKNSLQNARLLRQADGEDYWLHARGVPGAHVLLSAAEGPPGEESLLEAARLAAFYSAARGAGVPVDVTLRKYVRKTAGAPEGQVNYTRERTLMVSADETFVRSLKRG